MAVNPEDLESRNVGRRAFVKGSVAAAVTATVAGGAYALAKPLTIIKESNVKEVSYVSSFRVAGPAPRGIAWLPLEVKDGILYGIWDWPTRVGLESELGASNLDWYRYCGHETAPGLQSTVGEDGKLTAPFESDNALRYFISEDKLATSPAWFKGLLGQPMRVSDFTLEFTKARAPNQGPESGASGVWRSEDQKGTAIISVIVIKVKDPENAVTLDSKVSSSIRDAVVKNIVDAGGFIAYVAFCTHFCCVPGWKDDRKASTASSGTPEVGDGTSWDLIFCTCHLSRYNPVHFTIQKFLLAEAQASGSGAGAGAGGGGH